MEEEITEFQNKEIEYLDLIPEIQDDLKFVGIKTVSKLIENIKNGHIYSKFSEMWPKKYYEYIFVVLYLKCNLDLFDVNILKEIPTRIPSRNIIRVSIYDSIQRLELETATLEELKKANINTILELILLAHSHKLYDKLPDCPKAYFDEIDFKLKYLCGLWLPGIEQLKLRKSDKVYELPISNNISDGLSHIGITTIEELICLTKEELYSLPEIRDNHMKVLSKDVYSKIENSVHDAGFMFVDEVEDIIDIRQKPIVVLHLSEKIISKLYFIGKIKLVSELITKTKSELSKYLNGEMVEEVIIKLNIYGLELSEKDIDVPSVINSESSIKRGETLISLKRARNELIGLRKGPLARGRFAKNMMMNQSINKKEEAKTIRLILYER